MMSDIRGTTPQAREVIARVNAKMASEATGARTVLLGLGVKLAHPDDGWVKRDRNTFCPSYPLFNQRPEVGDLIAFGQPWSGYRLVRVTSVKPWFQGILEYGFDDLGIRVLDTRAKWRHRKLWQWRLRRLANPTT
jgi:hypothetical protein